MDIAIITIIDNNNFGNRLQNYALYHTIEKLNKQGIVILNDDRSLNIIIKRLIKKYICFLRKNDKKEKIILFKKFNELIKFSKNIINYKNPHKLNYDYYIVGSDQVWNPENGRLSPLDLLVKEKCNNKISYAASIGVENLSTENENKLKKALTSFKSISVREDAGKKIIEELTGRKDVEVLVDPTMLLSSEDLDKISRKPMQLDNLKNKKYILNYFLGNLSDSRKKEIERIAIENDCEIINILDKNDPFYVSGPSEFLYLEKNAFLVCTDSFHSCVFAILYNRPFVVFNREQEGIQSMNSRIDTLINKFKLRNREYNGKNITKENLEHDYAEAYKILEEERKKSDRFLRKALDIA